MIEGLRTATRKVLGLFVDDGSLALSILVWIFALHIMAPIVFIQTWAALVLFLGCVGILIENVLRASRQRYRLCKMLNASIASEIGPRLLGVRLISCVRPRCREA